MLLLSTFNLCNFALPFPYYRVTDERTPQTCKDPPPRAAMCCTASIARTERKTKAADQNEIHTF